MNHRFTVNGRIALAAALLILAAGTQAWAWPAKGAAPAPAPLAAPGFKPSVSTAFMDGATFVGSAACGQCHVQEFAQWSASGHANMLRPVKPEIVKGDFGNVEIAYEGVEVEDANKNKVKINPKVRTESKDGKFLVTLLDADGPDNAQTYEVVEALGSLWEQQYYLKVGGKAYPSPVRWVDKDRQWRKAPFASYWWLADGTPDGRPRKPGEMPGKQTVDMQCNGCHTTGFSAVKDAEGKYAFARQEGGIGCEVCHGPGSRHVQAAGSGPIIKPSRLGTMQQEQLCGQCHSRGASTADKDFAFPLGFSVGRDDLDARFQYWLADRPAVTWPNGDAKKNRQQYHDTRGSRHLAAGVTCITCHLDHATAHRKGSLRVERGAQCVSCHAAQARMFEGGAHAKAGVACADCHMAKMGNRAGATARTPKDPVDVTAHAMRVVGVEQADSLKMRSSCDACHKDGERAAYGARQAEARKAVLEAVDWVQAGLGKGKTRAGTVEHLSFVLKDGSFGAHNRDKALLLLGR